MFDISLSQYLLESSLCLALFYVFYHLVLRKETFFQLNRFYLLLTPLASLAIPLLDISFEKTKEPQAFDFLFPAISNAEVFNQTLWQQMEKTTPAFELTYGDLLLIIYVLGIVWMSFLLFKGIFRILKIIRKSKSYEANGYTLIKPSEKIPAASFFSFVFWSEDEMTDEKRLIVEHELVHVRQWHSLDVLIMELVVILKWFNPLIYLYRKALRVTHEYIADNFVVKKGSSVYQYASLLVAHSRQHHCNPLVNTFSALLKKRLIMLGQTQSRRWRMFKYFMSIPLFFCLMILFSFNLIEELPEQMKTPFTVMEKTIDDWSERTVLEIPAEYAVLEGSQLDWGGLIFPLEEFDGDISCDTKAITKKVFDSIKEVEGLVFKGNENEEISNLEILIVGQDNQDKRICSTWESVVTEAAELGEEFTLFMKINMENSKSYFAIITVSDQANFYRNDESLLDLLEGQGKVCFNYSKVDEVIKEVPTRRNINCRNGYFLDWAGECIPVRYVAEYSEENFIYQISPDAIEKLKNNEPTLFYSSREKELSKVGLAIIRKSGDPIVCVDKWEKRKCYDSTLAQLGKGDVLKIHFKTEKGKAFYAYLLIDDDMKNIESIVEQHQTTFEKDFKEFSYINLSRMDVAKPVFKRQVYTLEWGDYSAPINKKNGHTTGFLNLEPDDFLKSIKKEITVLKKDTRVDLSDFNAKVMVGNNKTYFSEEDMLDLGIKMKNGAYYFDDSSVSTLLDIAQNELTIFITNFENIEGASKIDNPISMFIRVKDNINESKIKEVNPETSDEVLELTTGTPNRFQFVHKEGLRTLIKMDTTDQKYRWMYDQYKDGKQLDILHIPNFKTIKRVVNSDDEIIPKREISKVEVLGKRREKNIYFYPEYYEFEEKQIRLSWRGHYATLGDQITNLRDFKYTDKKELILEVGGKQMKILNVELLFIPKEGETVLFKTDRVDHPEINSAIRKMKPHTSVYLQHMLIEDSNGQAIHFPLTLVLNLE